MRFFEDYLNEGVIKKCSVNRSQAKFFLEETERTSRGLFKRIEVLGIDDDNANSIVKDCYDILMELIRAKLFLSGYCSSGQLAHEAEISFLKTLQIKQNEILFLNDIRISRNHVTYYGKILNEEYAKNVVAFTKQFYLKLKEIVTKDLTK